MVAAIHSIDGTWGTSNDDDDDDDDDEDTCEGGNDRGRSTAEIEERESKFILPPLENSGHYGHLYHHHHHHHHHHEYPK